MAILLMKSGIISTSRVLFKLVNLCRLIQVRWYPRHPQLWYQLHLSLTNGLIDGARSNCPSRGIRYQPKRTAPSQPTTTTKAKPTATGIPFLGMGNLKVSTQGQGRGCIISHGAWFTSGTCATFRGEKLSGLLPSWLSYWRLCSDSLYLQETPSLWNQARASVRSKKIFWPADHMSITPSSSK